MVMRHLSAALAITTAMAIGPGLALAAPPTPTEVLQDWYKMVLELTRHTATMSPPVASRAYGYVGVTAYEIVASGSDKLQTLAGPVASATSLPDFSTAGDPLLAQLNFTPTSSGPRR